MPAAVKLQETWRRRRAAGGPAEETFAALVGLELRPRRLRDASTLWGSLRARRAPRPVAGVWMHPDLLPTTDLDDPLGGSEGSSSPPHCRRRVRRRAAQPPRGQSRRRRPTA